MKTVAPRLQTRANDSVPAAPATSKAPAENAAGPLLIDPRLLQLVAGGASGGELVPQPDIQALNSPRGGW